MREIRNRGDWTKLADYLRSVTGCGSGIRPVQLELTDENVKRITGSRQTTKAYKDHPQTDMVDHAWAAGYSIDVVGNGNFVFKPRVTKEGIT